jgi:Na+/proline symporter
MELAALDIGIILFYIVSTLFIGFWLSKRASQSLDSYFLGGNNIPWYYLGLSNASGMFDISGTMWMVYLLFVYGLKSVWIPWLWPVFNQIFLMVYMSVWLRRSQVMTGAEWIKFRFGEGRGAEWSHLIVVLFAILNVIGFLAYGFIGIGKFAATFLPWQLAADPEMNNHLYGLIITGITTLYVVKGGMMSVVFTEVLQFVVMTIACVAVGIIAMVKVAPDQLAAVIPAGWENLFFGWKLDLDWTGILDSANTKIEKDGWTLFGAFFMMMLFKGVLQSMAGPAPNYDMQRVLSARTPKEAAKMSGFVNLVLLFPRYMLITGLGILALVYFRDELKGMGDDVDFELILPFAMKNFVPVGLLGLLIAGLLAAFMSTFAATVNAAPAYLVNDIYRRYFKPNASSRHLVNMSYLVSVLVVVVGTVVGWFIGSLNEIIQWIVAALYGGYTAANVLKWHWWRFNGYGYFWGMATGMGSAMVIPELFPHLTTIYTFPIILAISLIGAIVGSLATPADDMEVLKNFYLKVRPWGWWKPVHDALNADMPGIEANHAFGRDAVNLVVGLAWQTSLTAAPIFLVTKMFVPFGISMAVAAVTMVFLKYNWYDKIEDWAPVPGKSTH